MIDKKLGDKPMYFELSIGNAGNTLDGHNESAQAMRDAEEEEEAPGKLSHRTVSHPDASVDQPCANASIDRS